MSNPERLAYWYFRLNGFLLLENFVVHPDTGRNQRTDADLIGVRMAHRSENIQRPMIDDPAVSESETTMSIVMVEIKTGQCSLNGPWTRPADENIHRVLRAIGCFPEATIAVAARHIYQYGRFQTSDCTCRLIAVGDQRCELPIPDVQQIVFNDMIGFIHRRFQEYEREKASVGNWSEDGRMLAQISRQNDLPTARGQLRGLFGLHG